MLKASLIALAVTFLSPVTPAHNAACALPLATGPAVTEQSGCINGNCCGRWGCWSSCECWK